MPALIVFSHLRWDSVFQRPRQLLSRLAKHYPVVFVEEPAYIEGEARFEIASPAPGVQVYRPLTPVAGAPGFHDEQIPALGKLMAQLVKNYPDHLAWFCTPMALPLLQFIAPRAVAYDCMDEQAVSRGMTLWSQREAVLMRMADVVFADSPGLHRARCGRHANAHCFPGGVDAAHFAQALDRTNTHPGHRSIPGPRLGFYGVIDEHFDAPLIGKLADAHPQWQVVLVGPVEGIDPASLPRRPNIHYLGRHGYDELPKFLAGWDVCLLPFVPRESAPPLIQAKALEYMVAELPVVSVPIDGIAELYGESVSIAQDAPAFIAACEAALLMSENERRELIVRMRNICARASWDAIADRMHELLQAVYAGNLGAELRIFTAAALAAAENEECDAASLPRPARGISIYGGKKGRAVASANAFRNDIARRT